MKYLYPFALALLLISCQKEEKKVIDRTKADWDFYKLKGDVKSVLTKSWLVNDNLEKQKTLHEQASDHDSQITFDDQGLLIKEDLFLRDAPFQQNTFNGREKKQQTLQYMGNAVGIKTDYTWDATGKNNTSIIRRNPDNTQIDRIEMKYQGDKLAEKITYSAQDNPIDKITYMYDSKGNLNLENIYLSSEYIQYTAIYKYNDKNKKVFEGRYDKDSKMIYETKYQFDNDGNVLKKITIDKNGEIEYSEDFTYDKKGNMLTRLTFEKYDNSKTIDRYAYDSNGNQIKRNLTKNDVSLMDVNIAFDKNNNQTLYVVKETSGKQLVKRGYTYEYDANGNWTKKTILIDDKPKFLVERQISYLEQE